MQKMYNTGIILIPELNGNQNKLDHFELTNYLGKFSFIKFIFSLDKIPLNDTSFMADLLKRHSIKRLVIAGFKPGFHKSFFDKAFSNAGIDDGYVLLSDFSDLPALNGDTLEFTKAMLLSTLFEVPFSVATSPGEQETIPETLIIGGGIAGIQASLEIGNSGNKVSLLEKTGTIGGHMAMFDKTFPTLDCAACILTPKMVEVGQHPNINLITYSEVLGVTGKPGQYRVKILKKARRVDLGACIGCGICAEKCPSKVSSEFDAGTTLRKAIYIPFPQAVPNKYLIDESACRYVQEGKCGVCVKVCPASCINLDEKDEEIELTVGNIVVATGFNPFDAKRIEQFGYGKYPNVVTSLEFERLINASGPTGGNITLRKQDKKGNWIFEDDDSKPDSIAIIHCVGSRDENYNKYCSRVCCMYSLKLAHLVKEKLPAASVYEYYIDMRAFGKGYEEFYERIKNEGVNIIRGRTAKIEDKKGKLLLRSEDILKDRLIEQNVDMVILSIGLEPGKDTEKLSKILNIRKDENGWFKELNSSTDGEATYQGGIYIAGACQGPKDIPDSVAQGSAAASKVIQNILRGKTKDSPQHISLEETEKRIKEFSEMK